MQETTKGIKGLQNRAINIEDVLVYTNDIHKVLEEFVIILSGCKVTVLR